ncbi:type III-A CRISPR-associated protein Csm2 [Haemophilus influenzae]|uniref:CRISPR system Cms protein Csm2 n=1 Tax=Haemophilus influenzae TaxID=727 RepID=A0AB37B1A8_HAEIF|nr:type III-A CRISPR-associated protein Csm2 [Haemophilus influenzae]PRJ24885.1 hypothetical protein BV056_00085 [Haemophilus influenzae]PRJ72313.1 hypothetical protein BV115_01148 [Haemophilus influenzae]PRM81567.1 hypothetical protein BV055_01602 [Haemophilus influenzae]
MFNYEDIDLSNDKNLIIFSDIAEKAAKHIYYENNKPTKSNKSTQIRKFYDELCMWENKVNSINLNSISKEEKEQKRKDSFQQYAPFIYMMKAKVAYSQARKSGGATLVNENFSQVFNQCINQIKDHKTLRRAKLFMEAVMGFYKLEESKKGKQND